MTAVAEITGKTFDNLNESENEDWRNRVTRTKTNVLMFLCSLVALTTVAVLWANLQNPESDTPLAWFAKWGAGMVLAEIVGLFVVVVKGLMSENGERDYSLFVYPDPDFDNLDPIWDRNTCRISGESGEITVRPVEHVGTSILEIPLSLEECKKLGEKKTLVISVKDNKGIEWSSSFHLARFQARISPDKEREEVLMIYGDNDE